MFSYVFVYLTTARATEYGLVLHEISHNVEERMRSTGNVHNHLEIPRGIFVVMNAQPQHNTGTQDNTTAAVLKQANVVG